MAPRIASTINHIMRSHGAETSELKWGKFTRKSAAMYAHIYQSIWQMIDANYLQFNCLVVDTSKVNHRQYNDGDRDLGFTKFLFTILYKYARTRGHDNRFCVFLDDRTTKHTPDKLKETLNARFRKDSGINYSPYRIVEFANSRKSRLIQLADLLSGLIAYDTNMHYLALDAAAHKRDFLPEARGLFRVPSFAVPTPLPRGDGFDIWHLDFDAKHRRATMA